MTSITSIAADVARILEAHDLVYLADDDQQAEALTATLRAMLPASTIFFVPSSDALPGDLAPASPANIGLRVAALHSLRMAQQVGDRRKIACIASGEAAARFYPPPAAFDLAPPRIAVGDRLLMEQLSMMLEEVGYVADDRVDEPGEMAVRGEVADIFPADAGRPARIEIANGLVASIRAYDPHTQRSIEELEALEIGRAAEPDSEPSTCLLEHVPPGVILFSERADKRRSRFLQLAIDAACGRSEKVDAVSESAWEAALSEWREIALECRFQPVPRFVESRSPLAALDRFLKPKLAENALILAGGVRDLRFLRTRVSKRLGLEMVELANWHQALELPPGRGGFLEMPADCGFVGDGLILIAAADLLGSRAVNGASAENIDGVSAFRTGDVHIGDVVVHEDHGVGIVTGLEQAPTGGGHGGEMIALEYAGGSRRLVAIDDADRIWRYGIDADAVTLDKLDGSSWLKRREAINVAILDSAKALTALAEARAKLAAPVLDPDTSAYEKFTAGFQFNETADQARAIAAVRTDLASGKPMDRLVIGDVGYGKTEVALRASALAALAGHQVVVAAPTTVLVRQHLASFQRRFEGTGLKVAGLSRLSSAAEKKAVKAGLADGSIQIVIGTGMVMAENVRYARLGLVVIDEEQRFGASDKSRLRGSGETHLLSLSATPIPRTLQGALVGLQQISIISTPPARRQPIRTSLDQFDEGRIRTALLREKRRGGQSFIVVPRIEDMAKLAEKLRRVVPDMNLVEAHGKMPPAQIDATMVGFAEGEGDVLLATNIIEAGLDIPRANTMIVWRADRFGLAQLHQLRGRVGRGTRRGQVILLTQGEDAISAQTVKRLRTLSTFDRLGAGFEISARDLDFRGAGDLLGETQSGHMKLIGVDLYQHLLQRALQAARGEAEENWSPEMNLGARCAWPETWIPEPDVRLTLYVRLSRLTSEAEIDAFEEELVDRFGPLPEAALTLMTHARLRLLARAARIARVDAGPSAIAFSPRHDFNADAEAAGLTAKKDRLLLVAAIGEDQRLERIQVVLEMLAT
ncbi:helicase-related protein [Sphingomonas sp. R1]|uniref:helicase-related protein n=1 Tax=Sphingomonas sp. R1 TaxID=399176 RepID=UPI002225A556|nr:helicase-related protein [Sphingomonas sp. R1]UYY76896.1 helicase-related protein [Sphingomonas sp. R1]